MKICLDTSIKAWKRKNTRTKLAMDYFANIVSSIEIEEIAINETPLVPIFLLHFQELFSIIVEV